MPAQTRIIHFYVCLGAAGGKECEVIMLGDISRAEHIYIAVGYTDMRKQIDGLSALVTAQFRLDPFSNSVFLFCGRNSRVMKALYWEGDGFVLLYKRLENGRFKWPRDESEAREITPQQFRWLLEGLAVVQPGRIKKTSPKAVI